MNPSQDQEDSDPQGVTQNGGKKTQRQRDRLPNPNNFRLPPYNSIGDHCQRPPSDFHQRQHQLHLCNGTAQCGKPPLAHWQYFMRHRPFGDSARFYQFPPPPRFPQFQFGTFPGRNSPRIHPRRENIPSRDKNVPPDGHLHKSRETLKDARPKTSSSGNVNGRKKYYKKKYSHDGSKHSKIKKESPVDVMNGTTVASSADTEDSGQFVSFNGNSAFGMDDEGIRISKSCDGSWLNETSVSIPSGLETLPVEEGAVGGVPASVTAKDTVHDGNDSCSHSDKDLIDEGAIFDLDNIFQNRENSKKSDNNFYSNSESGDDLDLVLGLEHKPNEIIFSSDESENGAVGGMLSPSGHNSKSFWNRCHKNTSCTTCSSKDLGSEINGIRNGLDRHNGHRNDGNDRNESQDSDGGEDTGDFIDTDLPSHTKHILSSSDEMDNISSSKESDEEDCVSDCRLVTKDKKYNSDFNCNDLSTLEPNILNGLHHLRMRKSECQCTGSQMCVLSNRHHSSNGTPYVCDSYTCNCDSRSRPSPALNSDIDKNSVVNNGRDYHDDSQHNINRAPCGSPLKCFKMDGSHSSIHGAAADIVPYRENVSRFPDHLGADSEVLSTHYHRVSSSNSRTYSSVQMDGQHVRPWTEHCSLPASGGYCISQPSVTASASGSGTSTGEDSAGCCAHQPYPDPSLGNDLDSTYSHNLAHVANGFNEVEVSPTFTEDENNLHPNFSTTDKLEDEAISSASSAGNPLEMKGDLLDKTSKEVDTMSGFVEDPLSLDSSMDHIDMVLLPMEEEIEPVYCMDGQCAGQAVFDVMEEEFGDIVSPDFQSSPSAGTPQAVVNASFEECSRPLPRGPTMMSGNRLPSKEFYELIKRVSATDSYMQFFDKDGQDVQRSTHKSVNEEDNPSKSKQVSKSSSGSKTDCLKVDRVMIWNEYEAYVVQYKQIAVSACGQTAVLNVLKALKFQCEKSVVCKVIQTNMRKEDKDIPHYLFSRACAGTTAAELMSGVSKLTGGVIGGRFFHFWPPRKAKLLQWLAYWMKRGAIPMATLNLQQGPHSVWEVPDSWHHQMVYGVSQQGLYLTNPLEIVSERSAIKQLCSDSVLLVRRQDIVSRFRESTDLGELLDHPDPRWMSMNVLGQVVNVLRECNMPSVPGYRLQVTSHVRIPALYEAGITLFMRKDKPDWNALVTASELPLA